MKNIISSWITTLLIILLICMIVIVIATQASGENNPQLFGYQFKTVLSGSMEPNIHTGSIIGIESVDDVEPFEEGDIITFLDKDSKMITHRIVEVKNDGRHYITKGDNNDGQDLDPVLYENIVGLYTGIMIPYIGYVAHFANTNQGIALIMITPGLVLLSHAGFTIRRVMQQLESIER